MRKSNGKSEGKSNEKSRSARNGAAAGDWNDQVAQLMRHDGFSREKARDQVIMDRLRSGDAGVLAALLIEGHVPSPNVRFALALMLLDNDEAEAAMARHYADTASLWLPHRFLVKPRPAQPRRPQEAMKGAEPAAHKGTGGPPAKSGPVMHDLGYEAAIARLDQAVLATDPVDAAPAARKSARQPAAPPKRRK